MDILFSLIVFGFLLSFLIPALSMAPWVPTRKADIERFLADLKLKKGDKFLEIGSGDARVSRAVANKFDQAEIIGIEYAFPMYCIGYILSIFQGNLSNLSLRLGDAFKEDFSSYDAIYVYGMPEKMQDKIVPKFLREGNKGAKLYSYVFSIPEEFKKDSYSITKENKASIHVLEKK